MQFSRLIHYLKPYWKWAALAPLMVMFDVATDLLQPRLIQTIIDKGIAHSNIRVAVFSGIWMLIVAFIGLAVSYGATYFGVCAGQGFGYELRGALFSKVQSLSFGNLDKLEGGSIITRLTNDVNQIQDIVATMLRVLVRVPMLLIGSFIMAVISCRELAFLYLIIIPIQAAILTFIINKSHPMFRDVLKGLDNINTILIENLSGVRVVRAFVRENYEKLRFSEANNKMVNKNITATRFNGVMQPFMMLSINAGIVIAIWIGGISVVHGHLHIGQLVAFTNYLQQTMQALTTASTFITRFSRAKASMQRVTELLDEIPEVQPLREESNSDLSIQNWQNRNEIKKIEFENVSFRYNEDNPEYILKNVSMTINRGETTAILGATGAGKSSLVNLIPRFYDAESGSIKIDDIDVRSIGQDKLRDIITICPQKSILFSGTVRENIAYACPNATTNDIIRAAKIAQAHDFIEEFPEGYETIIGQRGINLSGGQKQRISIARALLIRSSVLILDDSTSAVDVNTETNIFDLFSRHYPDQTRVIVAQRLNTVLNADKIIVLDNGNIVAEGKHEELLSNSAVYQEIYQSQMEGGVIANV
jgi:ATP-binding cassette subfamily B protein